MSQQFSNELLSTKRHGMEQFQEELRNTDFFTCECVGHDRFTGGTLSHSLWALYDARRVLSDKPESYPGVKDDSLIIACLLHDLGDIRRGYDHFSGHGRKAAMILNVAKQRFGLEISDEELSAIRFHRGHHIYDAFDKGLLPYDNTPLIKLLKKADHTVAGIMNGVPFGLKPECPTHAQYEQEDVSAIYNPAVEHWYIDTRARQQDYYPTRKGNIRPESLTRRQKAHIVFQTVLFSFAIWDLLLARRDDGLLGVFTAVQATSGEGGFYRSDQGGFRYKRVILYHNRFGPSAHAHYIVTENDHGHWTVIELTNPVAPMKPGPYYEFIARDRKADGCSSEKDALEAFRRSHHGINLTIRAYYERTEISL